MSPAGININKKQMNLRRGLLSINQAARPLMANTVQLGQGQTFSWPPPGLISPHSSPPPPGPFLSHSGTNSGQEGAQFGFGDPAGSRGIGGFLASRYQRVQVGPAHTPTQILGLQASPHRSRVLRQLAGALCSLFLRWQLP